MTNKILRTSFVKPNYDLQVIPDGNQRSLIIYFVIKMKFLLLDSLHQDL